MDFQWPQLLWGLLLIPILLLFYFAAQRRRRKFALRFTNLALLGEVVGRGPGIKRHIPPLLYLLGTAAMLISLARPEAIIMVPREQAAVVLAIDISGSMSAQDLFPSRMDAARRAALAFVDGLPVEMQAGVVAFRETASARVPLTRDHDLLRRGVSQLGANGGTAIGEAIHASLDQLAMREMDENGTTGPAIIVLLSDGESNQGRLPMEAAQRAQNERIPVYTIGIGQRGISYTLGNGQQTLLDEQTLKAVAESTGGQYFYAADSDDLTGIYADLSSRIAWIEERNEVTFLVSALGTVLFVLGALLSLRWFAQIP